MSVGAASEQFRQDTSLSFPTDPPSPHHSAQNLLVTTESGSAPSINLSSLPSVPVTNDSGADLRREVAVLSEESDPDPSLEDLLPDNQEDVHGSSCMCRKCQYVLDKHRAREQQRQKEVEKPEVDDSPRPGPSGLRRSNSLRRYFRSSSNKSASTSASSATRTAMAVKRSLPPAMPAVASLSPIAHRSPRRVTNESDHDDSMDRHNANISDETSDDGSGPAKSPRWGFESGSSSGDETCYSDLEDIRNTVHNGGEEELQRAKEDPVIGTLGRERRASRHHDAAMQERVRS